MDAPSSSTRSGARPGPPAPARRPWRGVFAALLLASGLAAAPPAAARTVTVAWDPNPDEEGVTGYLLYYGTRSRFDARFVGYDHEVDVGAATRFTVDLPDAYRTYFFAAAAYNAAGLRSAYSEEISTGGGFSTPLPTVNRSPTPADDAAQTDTGVPVTVDVLANDRDPDGDPLSVAAVSRPLRGQAVVLSARQVRYTPYPGFAGSDTFSYTVRDSRGASAAAQVRVTVAAPPPDPIPSSAPPPPSPEPADPTAGIVVDDRDPGASSGGIWFSTSAPGGYGGAARYCLGFGTEWYRWTPELPAAGAYQVSLWWPASAGQSSRVPVSVRHGGGTASVTVDQSAGGGGWVPLGTWTFGAGSTGWVEIRGEGGRALADAVRFVPVDPASADPGDPPPDPLPDPPPDPPPDPVDAPTPAPPPNAPPVARDDKAATAQDTPAVVELLANDTDPDGDPLAVSDVSAPASGTVELLSGGAVRYRPDPGFSGEDGFTYTAEDGRGGVATAQVRVTVAPLTPPTEPDRTPEVILDQGDPGAEAQGIWYTSPAADAYGGDGLSCQGFAGDRFRWTPQLAAGAYEVSLWWSAGLWWSGSAPVTVHHADGEDLVPVDQRRDGGRWMSLGTWRFEAGTSGWVELDGRNGKVYADAVRFVDRSGASAQGVDGPSGDDVIVDDGQPGTARAGPWKPFAGEEAQGGAALCLSGTADAEGLYRWTARLPAPGTYEVYLWWPTPPETAGPATVRVEHAGGAWTSRIDPTGLGGRWVYLGAWAFTADPGARVELRGVGGGVCADAARFLRVP
ncbi:MAG: hypothetical protein Kow0092_20750 [Deferrisomatales bacterium]